MRYSVPLHWKALLISTTSGLLLSACSTTTPNNAAASPSGSYRGNADSTLNTADNTNASNVVVNPAAPRTYVVQKGDTLWRIAQKFLRTPWHWSALWDKNQNMRNPHQLYPGDVLTLDYAANGNGQMAPLLQVKPVGSGKPIASLAPFLLWPHIMDEQTIARSPYLLASQDDHHFIGQGETVYAKNLVGAQLHEDYAIFHPGELLTDNDSNTTYGREISFSGYARVERLDQPATLKITEAQREIRAGDILVQPEPDMATQGASIHAPDHVVRAKVIELFDAEEISGNYMIVAINQGSRQQLEVGHALGIYAPGDTVADPKQHYTSAAGMQKPLYQQLPTEKVANVVLYKVLDNMSYGLIMDNSREVRNGYIIGNP